VIDSLLGLDRSDTYTCQNFARDVWKAITGDDISERAEQLMGLRILKSEVRRFERLVRPEVPCFVLCTQFGHDPHIGVLIERDRVLHLGTKIPQVVSLLSFRSKFTDTRYYR
jgi:hypothetical protein